MKTSKCKKHGIFTEEEAYVCYDKKYKDNKMLRCKKCHDEKKIRKFKGNTSTHCALHGDLSNENSYQCEENGRIRYRCKICASDRRKIVYAKNREQAIIDAAMWKKANRERVNKLAREDKLKNPEKYRKWQKDFYDRNREYVNTKAICRSVGIDIVSYEEMVNAQNKQCAICGKEETRKLRGKVMRLCIDHNHETGKIRALLCHDCNSGLGKFYDSPDLLTKAAIYLMDHNECH